MFSIGDILFWQPTWHPTKRISPSLCLGAGGRGKCEQGLSDEGVSAEDLQPARKAVRLEAHRLFFAGFLESNEGQAFVFHTIQDGILEPAEVSALFTRNT